MDIKKMSKTDLEELWATLNRAFRATNNTIKELRKLSFFDDREYKISIVGSLENATRDFAGNGHNIQRLRDDVSNQLHDLHLKALAIYECMECDNDGYTEHDSDGHAVRMKCDHDF